MRRGVGGAQRVAQREAVEQHRLAPAPALGASRGPGGGALLAHALEEDMPKGLGEEGGVGVQLERRRLRWSRARAVAKARDGVCQ